MTSQAALDVLAELNRQRARGPTGEGFDADHDDQHVPGELSSAAICYAANFISAHRDGISRVEFSAISKRAWPWDASFWKPKEPRRDLVRAAALLIAEIEKLDRK